MNLIKNLTSIAFGEIVKPILLLQRTYTVLIVIYKTVLVFFINKNCVQDM